MQPSWSCLRQVGVRLETVAQGPIDWDDAMSQISDAIRMVFKREQSSDTSRRILTRFIQMARDGKWINGKPPYSYAKDKDTGRLILGDPAEVRTIQWLYETYATRDVSLRWMAAELFRRGVPNPRGTKNGKGEYRWTTWSLEQDAGAELPGRPALEPRFRRRVPGFNGRPRW